MKMQSLQQTTKEISKVLSKNSPTILTGLGVAGLISTAVMAVKATPKAIELIDQLRDDEINRRLRNLGFVGEEELHHSVNEQCDVKLTKKEIIKVTWKCYVPAALMGVVSHFSSI